MLIECKNPEAVVKKAFFLAYQACGSPMGMGILQARGGVSEDDVWANVREARDYGPGADKIMGSNKPGKAYGDYVFGKMMKLGIDWDDKGLTVIGQDPRPDYQSWCRKYRTYKDLIEAAIKEIPCTTS